MGMNKQFTVTIDVTATMSNEQEANFVEVLRECAKDKDRPAGMVPILMAALMGGPEGALVQLGKQCLREALRETGRDMAEGNSELVNLKFAPARVEVKR